MRGCIFLSPLPDLRWEKLLLDLEASASNGISYQGRVFLTA